MEVAIARALRSDSFASISRILDAARRVFASGDGSGSLDRIAREAGVGIATLYRHFPNRQLLARAVFEEIFTSELEPLFAEFERNDAPRFALLSVAERLVEIADRERGLATSLGNMTQIALEFLRDKTEEFAPMVARAQRAGNLRPDIVAADIPNLLALIVGGITALGDNKAERRRYLSMLLDAVNPAHAIPLPQ
ncbi:TetR/AcrR family transcriptional regulator [soil metagenome]